MSSIVHYLNELTVSQPAYVQILIWVLFFLLVIFVLTLISTALFFPIMLLYNRLTDKNDSNVLGNEDYLMGELTTKIQGDSIGEVIETGSQTALSVYPAKLYRETDQQSNLLLPVGTKVLIIDFDAEGIALVVKNNNF